MVKSASEMSPRELRIKRKQWRKNSRSYLLRQVMKKKENQFLETNTPPHFPEPHQPLIDSRRKSGRKKVLRNRSKLNRDNAKLATQNKRLKTTVDRLRKRLYRKKIAEESPNSKIKRLVSSGDKEERKELCRKLIFHQELTTQLLQNYKLEKSRRQKINIRRLLSGSYNLLRRYKLITKSDIIKGIVLKKNSKLVMNNSTLRWKIKKINEIVKKDVATFFEDEEVAKFTPGKKDCITRHKIKKQKRLLTDFLKKLYKKFTESVGYQISYSSFCKLKPFWVCQPNIRDRETCACKTHSNMELLVQALFNHKVIDKRDVKDIVKYLCCETTKITCLQRSCTTCRFNLIPYLMFDDSLDISYWKWTVQKETFTDRRTNKMKSSSHLVKQKVTQNIHDVLPYFEREVDYFMYHEGNIVHQHKAIRSLKENLNLNEVLVHMDFSENYAMKYASEIQAVHFGGSRKQITLHTVVVYYKKNEYSSASKTCICTISESLEHGPAAIWAHLDPVFTYIKSIVPNLKSIHFLSDSPATQYRNRSIFYLITNGLQAYCNVSVITWNYHESGHGKGAPDGVGGCLKRTADKVVARGQDVPDFHKFYEVLKDEVRGIKLFIVREEDIDFIKTMLPDGIMPFKGTMKVHQIIFKTEDQGKLKMNRLSCFSCYGCDNFHLGWHYPLPDPETTDDEFDPTVMPIHEFIEEHDNNLIVEPDPEPEKLEESEPEKVKNPNLRKLKKPTKIKL